MNYIVENNIDFYKELNTNNSIDDLSNICLLTHQPLEQNYIKLECNHTFNYIPIYKEICHQKYSKNNYLETCYLSINEIKCPYCRNINSKLLPYINMPDVELKHGVNMPIKYSMQLFNCQWKFKSGKNKNCLCNKNAYINNDNTYCANHHKLNNKIITQPKNKCEIIWTDNHEKISNKYKIIKLKEILKNNKLKISGNKKELINRIILNNLLDFDS